MGTRHVIKVISGKETKLAQYWQWDWYPSWQGVEILKFLRNKNKIQKLKKKLSQVRFLDFDWKDKEFLDTYNNKETRTNEQKIWFKNFISRDVSSEILENIISFWDGEILLEDKSIFKENWILCERAYTVDLDNMVFSVWDKEFNINNLPSNTEFINILEPDE